jgi:hypothetical protein
MLKKLIFLSFVVVSIFADLSGSSAAKDPKTVKAASLDSAAATDVSDGSGSVILNVKSASLGVTLFAYVNVNLTGEFMRFFR